MEIGGIAIGASTITSVFTATLRISQAVYELKAVGEQTRDLLDTTKHINSSTQNVRIVRRQKSALLTTLEKEWIDGEIKNSEKAVRDVAALIEPARVDMQSKSNRTKDIRFKNRVMFVLRDSPQVAVQLTKLSIATQGLNAAMQVLCNREGHGSLGKLSGGTVKRLDRRCSSPGKPACPPSYELSEFMNRRRTTSSIPRRKDLAHKASRVTFIDEDRSDDEAPRPSTSRSQSTLRTQRSWATTQEILQSPEERASDTEKEVFDSVENSRDAPYLDRFDEPPACTRDTGIPPRAEAHSALPDGDDTYLDAWTLNASEALDDNPNIQPAVGLPRRPNWLSPNYMCSASVSRTSLDSSMARMAQAEASSPDQQHNARREETIQFQPVLVSHQSELHPWQTPGLPPPPPIPPRPASSNPPHIHNASVHSLPDGFAEQSPTPAFLRAAAQSPPFHFLTSETHPNENAELENMGRRPPAKPTKPPQFTSASTTRPNPPTGSQMFPPYPDPAPSTTPLPPLTQVFSSPLPWRPKPAHSPHRPPTPYANAPASPPYPDDTGNSQFTPNFTSSSPATSSHNLPYPYTDTISHGPPYPYTGTNPPQPQPPRAPPPTRPGSGLSLADTAHQPPNLAFYKPLPELPNSNSNYNTSTTTTNTSPRPSVTSTQSEPTTSSSSTGDRVSRGRMLLEAYAEQTASASATGRKAVGGPLSGGFLAPRPGPDRGQGPE